MPSTTDNAMVLWMWPFHAAKLGRDMMETALGAQSVISARMPTITAAMHNPFFADHDELGLMVSEKVGAFGKSGASATAAGEIVRRASRDNAKAMGRLAGGGILWPVDWMRLAETNLAATAALAALPAAMLAPLHSGVKANTKRLKA